MSFIDYVMGHLTIEHPHQRTIVNFSETFSRCNFRLVQFNKLRCMRMKKSHRVALA